MPVGPLGDAVTIRKPNPGTTQERNVPAICAGGFLEKYRAAQQRRTMLRALMGKGALPTQVYSTGFASRCWG